MSNVYSTEPQTTANVVFETTHGPLNIHLWAKECPYTTRYFLQLCLDGYYDNLPFSRIIHGFMIQTGDSQFRQPSPSQSQPPPSALDDETNPPPLDPSYLLPPQDDYRKRHASAEALERRKLELNSRIRFNHRGQLAMAMNIDDDPEDLSTIKLQPQFFITLEDAPHLDGQHVLFGTVVGASIFNAIRIGQTADVDETTNQPTSIEEAPRILRTKVQSIDGLPETLPALVQTPEPPLLPWHVNPYPQSGGGGGAGGGGRQKKKKKARKGVKNINLLSFAEEMEGEDDGGGDGIAMKPKASKPSSKKGKKESSDKEKKNKTENNPTPHEGEKSDDKLDDGDDEQGRRSTIEEATVLKPEDDSKTGGQSRQKTYKASDIHESEEPAKVEYQPTKKKEEHQSSGEHPALKSIDGKSKSGHTEEAKSSSHHHAKKEKKTKQKKISLVELRRAKYARYQQNNKDKSTTKNNKQSKEEEKMKKLMAFRQKVASVTSDDHHHDEDQKRKKKKKRKRNDEDGDDDNDEEGHYYGQVTEDYTYDSKKDDDWMTTKFKCRRHMDHDAGSRNMMAGSDGRSANDYTVVEDKNIATDRKQDRRKNHHQR